MSSFGPHLVFCIWQALVFGELDASENPQGFLFKKDPQTVELWSTCTFFFSKKQFVKISMK